MGKSKMGRPREGRERIVISLPPSLLEVLDECCRLLDRKRPEVIERHLAAGLIDTAYTLREATVGREIGRPLRGAFHLDPVKSLDALLDRPKKSLPAAEEAYWKAFEENEMQIIKTEAMARAIRRANAEREIGERLRGAPPAATKQKRAK
jgi:hypothetical protein